MKKSLFKIKNPELFQGEKYLENKKDYFELRKKDKISYSGTSKNCGFEVVD